MSRPRLLKKFGEQIEYIRTSARQYDFGNVSEAFRIATALRVIFHRTRVSTPLITHLRIEDWQILSTVGSGAQNYHGYISIRLALNSPTPVSAVPKLGNQFFPMPFSEWWNQGVYIYGGRTYTRKDLVLCAVNKDGGAHVDFDLEEYYRDLESGLSSISLNGQGLVFTGGPAPFDQSQPQRCQNLHVAIIRQFGHELLASERHFDWPAKLQD